MLTELRDLPEVDVSLSGFDTEELKDLLAELEAQQEGPETNFAAADAPVTVPASGRVQPGQLWSLGRHKLHCGEGCDPGLLADGQKSDTLMVSI